MTALDDAVANVTAALRRTGLYRDSIVVFLSDNGGAERGSNWPLRGKKNSVYEGGTRTVAFVHSPKFIPKATAKSRRDNSGDNKNRRGDSRGSRDDGSENNIDSDGKVARGLVHIVDWYPTLLALATNGGCSPNINSDDDGDDYDNNSEDRNNNMPDDGGAVKGNDGDVLALPLDGVNQARHLFSGAPAPRTELIYNINDAMRVTAAIRCTAKKSWYFVQRLWPAFPAFISSFLVLNQSRIFPTMIGIGYSYKRCLHCLLLYLFLQFLSCELQKSRLDIVLSFLSGAQQRSCSE